MTYTVEDIPDLFALFEAANLRPPASYGTERGYDLGVQVWAAAIAGVPRNAIHAGLALHLRDPMRGRFWPSPADILAHIPQAHAPAVIATLDPDEQAWERILEVLRKGPDAPDLQSTMEVREVTRDEPITRWDSATQAEIVVGHRSVTRAVRMVTPSAFERALAPAHRDALAQIGGLYGLRKAEAGDDPALSRAAARKRFLALCRTANPAIEAAPRPALEGEVPRSRISGEQLRNAPPMLQAMMRPDSDPHLAARRAAHAREISR